MSAGAARVVRAAWPYAAVALVAALPLAGGPFSGRPLYFRDLSLSYFPFRRFMLEGLLQGELRFWNPYVHEGEPLVAPPVSYPFDLFQLLRPDEIGISFVLALHVPLAALWMMALARHGLGLSTLAGAAAGIVYALGGFALSTVNLYVYAQALAWAPAAILAILGVARGDRRAVGWAALAIGVLMSTTAAELVAQALVAGLVLALPLSVPSLLRIAAATILGATLAAPTAIVVARVVAESARAEGLAPDVVLAHSIHPLTLAQVVIAGFHGDPSRITERWWGANFFPNGFPYFLSLYLGLTVVVIAGIGLLNGMGPRKRLAVIAVAALGLALGRWGVAGGIVETFEVVRRFRYPSKMFFSVHLAVTLLAALGIDALAKGAHSAWRRLSLAALAAGLVAASAPFWPGLAPATARWFAAGFFPPELPWAARLGILDWVLGDAAVGGAVAVAAGMVALLVHRGRLAAPAGGLAVAALVAADLLRAGAGLNRGAAPAFYVPSPEVERHRAHWRRAGRVFTCEPAESRAYAAARAVRPSHESWTFALMRDTAVPLFNVNARLASALSRDLTMMVPPQRLLDVADTGCPSPDRLIATWRVAGVAHVLSLDPLLHPDLTLQSAEQPAGIAPLVVHAYALRDPLPMISFPDAVVTARTADEARARLADPAFDPRRTVVIESDGTMPARAGGIVEVRRRDPGHIELQATTPDPAILVVREAWHAGWQATIDGTAAPLLRANGRHMAVVAPAGSHAVRLDYEPAGFRAGALIAMAGAIVMIGLLATPRSRGAASP